MEKNLSTNMNANVLTLSKCAYIFHWSDNAYSFGDCEYLDLKTAMRKALYTIYDNPEKGVNIPYTIENGRAYIELDGVKIDVYDTMLQSVSGEYPHAEIVNGRTFKNLRQFHESFNAGTFTALNESTEGDQYFMGAKLKSLYIEVFPDSLRYYRLHFRGNRLDLIASNGKVYDAGGGRYTEITTWEILSHLEAGSSAAKKIIKEFINYIID